MADITLSSAVRSNLLSLQNTADLLGRTQERLATGLKVNSALDDPTAFFTASALNSRASDLNRLLDSVGNAVQTIEAADAGISAITDLVEQAQASARQARQTSLPVTAAEAIGAASASFTPSAFAAVAGTGATATSADVSSTLTSGNLGTDANVAAQGTDIGGDSTTTVASLVSDADSFTIEVDGTTYTVQFSDGAVGHNITNNTLVFDRDAAGATGQVSSLTTQLDTLLASENITVTFDGSNRFNFDAQESTTEYIRFADATGTNVADLNLDAVGSGGTGGSTTDRLATRNAAIAELAHNGDTLQVDFGGATLATLTFGTGANISNRAELLTALNNLTGIDAADNGTAIDLSSTDTTDADSEIVLTATDNNALATVLGFTPDVGGGSVVTGTVTNLLSGANGLSQGDTLSITIGSSTSNITFGTGTGEISTFAELSSALTAITGGSASVVTSGGNTGNVSISAANNTDTITIGDSNGAAARFGLTTGEFSNLVGGTGAVATAGETLQITVGSNATATITFGTGSGQVNTFSELESALGSVAGATATIDSATGAVSVSAIDGTNDIVIGGDTGVPAYFGLSAQTYASTTTNNSERAALESQFNTLVTQIDQLARDADFNGNNLLQSDNLQVVFNEDATSSLTISGVDFDSGGLGISQVASDGFQSNTTIDATLATLDTAIGSLRTQASTFGSNLSVVETRQQFTEELSNVLETGAANLTLADLNEEGANTLALQTRQQLSSVALSLASQADQQVLRLF